MDTIYISQHNLHVWRVNLHARASGTIMNGSTGAELSE